MVSICLIYIALFLFRYLNDFPVKHLPIPDIYMYTFQNLRGDRLKTTCPS